MKKSDIVVRAFNFIRPLFVLSQQSYLLPLDTLLNILNPRRLNEENLTYHKVTPNPCTKLNIAREVNTPFKVCPNGVDKQDNIAPTPNNVTKAKSLNALSPNIVPSPANTRPLTKCINDDIIAGPLIASRTSVNGENQGVMIGNANH